MRNGLKVLTLTVMLWACIAISTQQAHSDTCTEAAGVPNRFYGVGTDLNVTETKDLGDIQINGTFRMINDLETLHLYIPGLNPQKWNRRTFAFNPGQAIHACDVPHNLCVPLDGQWHDFAKPDAVVIIDATKYHCVDDAGKKYTLRYVNNIWFLNVLR